MNIKNHGTWSRYYPTRIPAGFPENTMFAKRDADNKDWYEYIRSEKSFEKGSVRMMAFYQFDRWVIGPAVRDVSMLFPANQMVLEVTGHYSRNLEKDFGRRVYDPKTNTISKEPFGLKEIQEELKKQNAVG